MHDRYFYTTEVMYYIYVYTYIDIWQEKLVQRRTQLLLLNILNKYIGIDVNVNLPTFSAVSSFCVPQNQASS